MKKKLAMLVAGTLAASMLLSGCSSNDASNDYVTVGGYKGIEVDDVKEPAEVTDDDVNNYIEAVRNQYATSEQITDRGVIAGDTVNIDFVGKMNGEAFDGGSSEGYDLKIGSGSFIDGFEDSFIDGFEDSIIGHTPGETFDWNGKFPDDYSNNPDLAGKDVTFTITVNYINGETQLPELNDEFVQEVSEKSKTVKEYKKEIKKQLTESNTTDYDTQLQDEAWNAVLEKAEVKKYPDGDVEDIENQIKEQYQNAADSYGLAFEDFLAQYYSMSEDDFNKQVKDAAKETVKQRLVAQAIADKEKLTPSKKELNKEYKKLAEQYGYEDVDALKEIASEDTLKNIVITNKVKDFLAENCIQVKSDKKSDSSSSSDSSSK